MNKRVLYIILYFCLPAIPTYGQQIGSILGDDVTSAYNKAYDLNESKNYLEAYRQIMLAEQTMDATLFKKGVKATELSDEEFRYPYWAVKKSKAEIAYMLGIHVDMETVSTELHHSVDGKKWSMDDSDAISILINGFRADLAKIDGGLYYLTEQYDSSELALKDALRLGNFYGNDFFLCKVHDDLAQLYYKQGEYSKALAHLDSIMASPPYQNDSRDKETQQNIKLVRSQRALCLAQLRYFNEALKEIESVVLYFKQTKNIRLYAESLRKKAKILMLQYDSTGKYSPEAVSCYQQYLSISKNYIDMYFVGMSESEREQYWMAEQPFVTDCFRLENKAPELLYDVALFSKAVLLQMGRDFKDGMTDSQRKDALASIRVTWQQVRDKLPKTGCAIEFIVYEKKGVKHIGSLVINRKSARPKFIDVGKVSDISDHQINSRLKVVDVFADTQNKEKINALYNDSVLYHIIWNDVLMSAIGNSDDIYFSPDGIFHQMGIEYLVPPTLTDKRFYRLTTTRLLIQGRHTFKTDNMLVCGGIEYGLTMDDKEGDNDELTYSLLAPMELRLTPLPNSSAEVDSIIAIRKSHNKDMILRADSVTEAALKTLLGKYHIVHISTHGLFSEVSKIGNDIHPSSTDTQLSKSCLFLSGSEKNLRQKDFDASQHDGILSARELSKMNMSDVDLTVMSACMSGLGYITPDGVYGLQRGLKTAGVKAIISTMWSVDDEASCYFIVQLYKNLERGQGLYKAFWSARESLMKYEKTYGATSSTSDDVNRSFTQKRRTITIPKFDKPYFYNAFILIDGI